MFIKTFCCDGQELEREMQRRNSVAMDCKFTVSSNIGFVCCFLDSEERLAMTRWSCIHVIRVRLKSGYLV
jgi:hypothetical protein